MGAEYYYYYYELYIILCLFKHFYYTERNIYFTEQIRIDKLEYLYKNGAPMCVFAKLGGGSSILPLLSSRNTVTLQHSGVTARKTICHRKSILLFPLSLFNVQSKSSISNISRIKLKLRKIQR